MSSNKEKILNAARHLGATLDGLAVELAPEYAHRRLKARRSAQFMYEGASKDKRFDPWHSPKSGPNIEISKCLPELQARSRERIRNHGVMSRAKKLSQSNTVGIGIIPAVKDNPELEQLLRRYVDRAKMEQTQRHTLYSIQRLIAGAEFESGEVLVVRQRLTSAQVREYKTPIPLHIKVLESDHLDSSIHGELSNGNFAIQGVEFTPSGKITHYHLFHVHPGDGRISTNKSSRIPREDVIHVFEELRPGQVRGVPRATPILARLRDFDEYESAQIIRQKVAAAYSLFVTTTDAFDDKSDPDGLPDKLVPGTIEYLSPGESIEFASPPGADGFGEFCRINLRAIAVALDVSYEALTGDYSQVNFASGRMGELAMRGISDQKIHLDMIPQFCHRLEEWIEEAAESVGISAFGSFWQWTPPHRPLIDPVRETSATAMKIRHGLSTLQEEHRRSGRDSQDVFRELSEDAKTIDALNLILDSDPRKTTGAGMAQAIKLLEGDD